MTAHLQGNHVHSASCSSANARRPRGAWSRRCFAFTGGSSCFPLRTVHGLRESPMIVRCQASEAAVQEAGSSQADVGVPPAPAEAEVVPTSSVWEVDFCSRPLLDERGKKVWELLITDPQRSFEYSQYFPNSKINSAELRKAVEALLARKGATMPEKARFFRGAMQAIITKALTEVGIKALPSRRCFSIIALLQERLDKVYQADPRYNEKATSLFNLELGPPEALPDALRGEKWAFVQLPLGDLQRMLASVEAGDTFGASFDLATAGLGSLSRDLLVPGVVVFSRRSMPLAAWTNGLEIASVRADVERSCLLLETGVNQRWKYGAWRPSADSEEEARGWEEAKEGIGCGPLGLGDRPGEEQTPPGRCQQ